MKFHKLLIAAFATLAFVGCGEDSTDPNEDPSNEDPGTTAETYTITIDKDTIEADGKDCVTFQVLDSEGKDILVNEDGTDSDLFSKVYFVNQANDKRLERKTKTFSAIRNGEYTFYATIRGVETANTVTIKVQNRANYEKYLQKVCIYQMTATWCGYCPQMTEALHAVRNSEYGENIILMACHAEDDYALPWSKAYDLGRAVNAANGVSGYPNAAYDMLLGSGMRSESAITSYIDKILLTTPATCGVKISEATIDDAGNATITASVKASKDGVFDLGCAILADNQPSKGGTESVYHDVVAAVSPNFIQMSDEKKVSLKADEEMTKTFTVTIAPFTGVTFNKDNYKVVVYAHSEAAGGIDNANACAFGSSVDYILNE